MKPRTASLLVLLATAIPITTGAQDFNIAATSKADWLAGILTIATRFDLVSAGLKMPTGRAQAEEFADMEFPRLARPEIYRLQVDSSSTVENSAAAGLISSAEIGQAIASARRSAAVLSPDFATLTGSYRIDFARLRVSLIRHRQPAAPPRVLDPRPTRTYTGIVVVANERLNVHGTRGTSFAAPCFFPKLWDTEMNLVYERNMVEPEIARTRGIVRYADRLDATAYADVAGNSPLLILARGFFGTLPTDPIIDRDDALKILSSAENRALLREGKVVFVLSQDALGSGNER